MGSIQVTQLGKAYKQYPTRWARLAEWLIPFSAPRHQLTWVLRDISFCVSPGEALGIIGVNGAGKSTLLKILSRITEPTEGRATVRGRVGALLEVGTGFHGELTGRENVFLYGAILGMNKAEIRRKFDAIVDFSGVARFVDTPVKRYSSGMYVRLAFSVAAHLEPEILLLDEVLSVGDLPFQRRCIDFVKQLQRRDATILFVSHNMFSIKAMCERAIYLQRGRIRFDGAIDEAIRMYEDACRSELPMLAGVGNFGTRRVRITAVELLDEHTGRPRTVFGHGERMCVRLYWEAPQPIARPSFVVAFIRSDQVACCNYSSESDGHVFGAIHGAGSLVLRTPALSLVAEHYTIHVLVREEGFGDLLCAQVGGSFHVRDELFDRNFGVFHECGEWRLDDASPIGEPGPDHRSCERLAAARRVAVR